MTERGVQAVGTHFTLCVVVAAVILYFSLLFFYRTAFKYEQNTASDTLCISLRRF